MNVKNKFKLKDQVIIITGGAGLLGSQYAQAITQAGGIPIIADINEASAKKIATEINRGTRIKALGLHVDVTSKDSVQKLITKTLKKYGRIDGLINNAALDPKFEDLNSSTHTNSFEDYPKQLWDQSLDVNITGMFLCAQAVAPVMLKAKAGSIVNICSTYGLVGPDQRLYQQAVSELKSSAYQQAVSELKSSAYQKADPNAPISYKPVDYSVTKSAVLGLTRYLATYWAGKGLRVNTLTLGGVFNNHDDEFVRRYSTRTTLGRMAEKDEYNAAIVFLLSEASSYMSGSNLIIDGGWTAW